MHMDTHATVRTHLFAPRVVGAPGGTCLPRGPVAISTLQAAHLTFHAHHARTPAYLHGNWHCAQLGAFAADNVLASRLLLQ